MKLVNSDIYKFIEIVRNKCLICFGSGAKFRSFIDRYKEYAIENYIDYIADNDKNKAGKEYELDSKIIPIISPEDIKTKENSVVLITCSDIQGVLTQLNSYTELDDIPCFVCNFIYSETNLTDDIKHNYPDSFRITSKPMIPKMIHYCWFGGNPIPDRNRMWMESWKRYCPDYEIICWNESNYDVKKNKYMYDAYQAKKWGFVPDFARLDIIYEYGGIYLDTDVELVSNLDDLLYQPAFAGVDVSYLVSLGLGFGAMPKFHMIRELKEQYCDLIFGKANKKGGLIPAPALQREYFANKGYKQDGNYTIIDGMTIYPEKVLAAKCNITGRILPTERTRAIHHYDASWITDEQKNHKKYMHELILSAKNLNS